MTPSTDEIREVDPAEIGLSGLPRLWVRGNLFALRTRSVAIIGSRACTMYGERVAYDLGHELAEAGWTIATGGAYGIDNAAHRGASGKRTIAVLAGGLDRAYPRGNAGMFETIVHTDGLLVSASPPGSAPYRHQFLERNELLAKLVTGTVVVEASSRGGSMHMAGATTRAGIPLMAVPGPVTSAQSAGTNALIRDGRARLVTSRDDVQNILLGNDQPTLGSEYSLVDPKFADVLVREARAATEGQR